MGVLDILRGRVDGAARDRAVMGAPARRFTASSGSMLGRSTAAWVGESAARGWSASATAYRCVNYIATNLASVDLTVLDGQGEPNDQHEIAVLWNRQPNTLWSARVQKEWVFTRAELHGEALLYVDRGATADGPAQALWPIYDRVEVLVDNPRGVNAEPDNKVNAKLLGFRVRVRNGPVVDLLPSEVLWLRYPDPWEPWGALAPWKAALHAAQLDHEARRWQMNELQHGSKASTVVYLGDLDEDAYDAAKADFKANMEGPDSAGRAFLVAGPEATKVDRLSLTAEEVSYIESRGANADEIMMAFGLRADLLRGEATWENQRASKTSAWSDVLVPKLEVMAGETDRQLLPDLSETAAFDVSNIEALREQADALWQRVAQYGVTPDVLTLDEARAALGYDPLPGGVGSMTITPYKSLTGPPPAPTGRALGQLLPRAGRILITRRGVVRVSPTGASVRRTPRPLSKTHVLSFYDRNETIGQRATRKLATKQERVVLRRLRDLLGRSNPDDLARQWALQAESCRIGSSPWTQLPVAIGAARIVSHDLFDADYWRGVTQEQYDAWLTGVWTGGASAASEALGVDFAHFERKVLIAMETRRDVLAHKVTQTTLQILDAQLLQAGLEGGESVTKLAARITAVFADLSQWRAETIARTETVGGYNGASRMLAKESGVVKGRTWLATADARTRPSHAEMDGETVQGMNGRYSNGLLHPGDPGGDPGETINCRCVETYDV